MGLTAATPSKPKSGYVYRSASFLDFHTLGNGSERTIGNVGVYEGSAYAMSAAVDLPPVALVRDVEFYFLNDSADALMRCGVEASDPSGRRAGSAGRHGSRCTRLSGIPDHQLGFEQHGLDVLAVHPLEQHLDRTRTHLPHGRTDGGHG